MRLKLERGLHSLSSSLLVILFQSSSADLVGVAVRGGAEAGGDVVGVGALAAMSVI